MRRSYANRVAVAALALTASALDAQAPASRTAWEFTAGSGNGLTSISAGLVGRTNPVLAERLRFGLGLRATYAGGDLSHQLVEYRATRNLSSNTDRFRSYTNLIFVGVRLAR